MQGNSYQIDKVPLLDIPIHKPSDNECAKIAALVDKIIAGKQHGTDTKEFEKEIDRRVYFLYDITDDNDIDIIELQ